MKNQENNLDIKPIKHFNLYIIRDFIQYNSYHISQSNQSIFDAKSRYSDPYEEVEESLADATDIFNAPLTTGTLGVGYAYSGAGKALIIDTTSYTGASVPQIDAQANNTALKIRIAASNVDHTQFLAAFGGLSTGGGSRLQYSVLNQLPAF